MTVLQATDFVGVTDGKFADQLELFKAEASKLPPTALLEAFPELMGPERPNEDAFLEIQKRFDDLFQVTTVVGGAATRTRSITDTLPLSLLAVDVSLEQQATQIDPVKFRFQHVEQLVYEAEVLLERAVRDRIEYDDKAVKAFELGVQLREFFELDEIHNREVAAGFYSLPFRQSLAEWHSLVVGQKGHLDAANTLENLRDIQYSPARRETMATFAGAVGFLSKLPTFEAESTGEHSLDHLKAYDIPPNVDDDATTQALPNVSSGHLLRFNAAREQQNQITQSSVFAAQIEEHRSEAEAIGRKKDGAFQTALWNLKDIGFRTERSEVARRLAQLKSRLATVDGGILNYPERMAALQARVQSDFAHALVRIRVAHDGLRDIYGFGRDLPNFSGPIRSGFLDDCLLWLKDAIEFLRAFALLDQNYILPVSLTRELGSDLFLAGLTKSGSAEWNVTISEKLFGGQRHVRLRGLSVVVVGDNAKGLWQGTVRVPRESACLHLSEERHVLDQRTVPSCPLGTIEVRQTTRVADVIGINALCNASPIGEWRVTLSDVSNEGTKTSLLSDVQLELHLAIRSVVSDPD